MSLAWDNFFFFVAFTFFIQLGERVAISLFHAETQMIYSFNLRFTKGKTKKNMCINVRV